VEKLNYIDLIELYLSEQNIAETTRKQYFRVLSLFYIWFSSLGLSIYDLQKSSIIEYRQSLKDLSSLTVVNYLAIIKCFYTWAAENDILPNLTKGLKLSARYKGFKKMPLTNMQATNLLKQVDTTSLKGKRDFAILNLLLRNGLRVIELQRINIGDFKNYQNEKVISIQRKGRTEKDQMIVLSDKTIEAVHDYLMELPKLQDHKPMFVSLSNNHYHKRIDSKSVSHIVKKYLIKSGLNSKQYTAHSLRHTAAINSLKNGSSEYETMVFMGHSNFQTTQIYTRYIEGNLLLHKSPSKLTDKIF